MRQVVLDTETTGLIRHHGCHIIEFAVLKVINRKLAGKKLHLYFNPQVENYPVATSIYGLTNDRLKDEPLFADKVQDIIEFIDGAEFIIYNAPFDLGFLDHHFNLCGLGKTAQYTNDCIDTLMLSRSKLQGARNSLDALCDRLNVGRSNRYYHVQ